MNSPNNSEKCVNIELLDANNLLKILDSFKYEADDDSATGMSFFSARISEDFFFILRNKLEQAIYDSV